MGEWHNKFLPLRKREEVDYGLPYFMALRVLELGEATDDNLAELAGHLRIAKHLGVEVSAGLGAIEQLIDQWRHREAFDPEAVECVGDAIRAYHDKMRTASRLKLKRAIAEALKNA